MKINDKELAKITERISETFRAAGVSAEQAVSGMKEMFDAMPKVADVFAQTNGKAPSAVHNACSDSLAPTSRAGSPKQSP